MRALVLQGGGSRGAFQAGALLEEQRRNPKDYDLIAGVSVGALGAGFLASCERGSDAFSQRVEEFAKMWTTQIKGSSDVYKRRFFGWLSGYGKMSLNKTTPLKKLIHEHVDPLLIRESGRQLRIGAWNATLDRYEEATENNADLREWIRASSAFPLLLEPVVIDGCIYADGGVRNNLPQEFLSRVRDKHDLEIDVFMTDPVKACGCPKKRIMNAKDMAVRLIEAMANEVLYNDLTPYISLRDKAVIRVFAPHEKMEVELLDFDQVGLKAMFESGRKVKVEDLRSFI